MSDVTDKLREALSPMSLDITEPEPIVAIRHVELAAMLDVIEAAENALWQYHEDAVGVADMVRIAKSLTRLREVAE